ncbi:T9SS type A sorting domain-containing protein [Candidatus Marinimicrobia bacterium MT.SAG.3]|nr:T9SS type A sorting domain-containing protein [Candidatus Marinimicrobia bacterium MT.SAG.3]
MRKMLLTIMLYSPVVITILATSSAQGQGLDYESDIQPIFTNNCTSRGCHVSGNEGNGLNLQFGNSYNEITGMNTTSNAPLVIAGSPDISKLIWKLEGVDNNGANVFGSRMPAGGPSLSQTTVDKIRQWISDGAVLSVLDDDKSLPEGFELEQNYPNPFNPQTTIEYTIARRIGVKLTVYNILGQEIAILVDEVLNQGVYSQLWDASNLTTGLYFYTLEAGGGKTTKKLLYLK